MLDKFYEQVSLVFYDSICSGDLILSFFFFLILDNYLSKINLAFRTVGFILDYIFLASSYQLLLVSWLVFRKMCLFP